ncbi:hypothetical protein [Carnobacterium maltaromaticum]|uniref:hypothetical protein n=1 Tax=Carnobacterium maltaromaticum TaxID=2751 RepID=UPI00191BB5B9|nr:hypothetical protein [Carnobacterium maltaromaticum]CAD5902905.1 conserved hypothetical protein [Carnobacterium maltaromaticum]
MEIITIIGLTLTILGNLLGYSKNTDKDKSKEISQSHQINELNKVQNSENVPMSITYSELMKCGSIQKNNKLIEMSIEAENVEKDDTGVGADDYYFVVVNGKKYEMNRSEKKFGDIIKLGGELKEKMYYIMLKNLKLLIVIYFGLMDKTSRDKMILEWGNWSVGIIR